MTQVDSMKGIITSILCLNKPLFLHYNFERVLLSSENNYRIRQQNSIYHISVVIDRKAILKCSKVSLNINTYFSHLIKYSQKLLLQIDKYIL